MPTYRCEACDVNYPPSEKVRLDYKCRKCGEKIEYFTNKTWDEDWRERTALPEAEASGSPHPAEDHALVIYRNDSDTIHVFDKDLVNLGYFPADGDVVKLNGKFYELLGYSRVGKIWWIEPFDFHAMSNEINELPLHEGGFSSDDIVALDHDGKTVWWDPRTNPFNNPEAGIG